MDNIMTKQGCENLAAVLQQEPWYEKEFTLESAMEMIRGNLIAAVRNYVAVGFYLKAIRDRKLYEEAGYLSFEDFVRDHFDKDKTWASRCIKVNDKLSKDGNTPILDDQYRKYNVSQLVELSYMTEEQRQQASPDMTVGQLRDMRRPQREIPYFEIEGQLDLTTDFPEVVPEPMEQVRPEARTFMMNVADLIGDDMGPEEVDGSVAISQQTEPQLIEAQQPLSAYGTPKLVYPEDSLIVMNGCGGGHGCFSCHLECNIRQEECYCVEAPMGNPFPCTTMDVIGRLRTEIESRCQFVNLELAYHRAGDHEPVPCCKECNEMCGYRCERAAQPEPEQGEADTEVIDAEFSAVEEPEDKVFTDLEIAERELKKAKDLLTECLKTVPDETDIYIRQMKARVAALASLVSDLDDIENPPPKPEQPELPVLKNNDQRAAFVDAYETWPLWIETKETGERYYRYDLPDGSTMVVKVYHAMLFDYSKIDLSWEKRYTEGYGRHEYYLLEPGKFFRNCEANRSALIDKLKEIQKKSDMPEKGTKMYSVHEHLYYVKGRSGPLREYCVYEGIVKEIRKVGYTELCLIAKDADGHEKMFFYPTKEIGKSVFYTPVEAALLARDKTEQYEETWARMLEEPLRRSWEDYLVEEKG